MPYFRPAIELDVLEWLNTAVPIRLAELEGKVVVIGAFQILCPGCVEFALPQLARVSELFAADQVAVIGLHTVFELHEKQGSRETLASFLARHRYRFPVGIDRPSGEDRGIPNTMHAYNMQGTPTLVLIDRQGRVRRETFGHVSDLRLGAEIQALLMEPQAEDAPRLG